MPSMAAKLKIQKAGIVERTFDYRPVRSWRIMLASCYKLEMKGIHNEYGIVAGGYSERLFSGRANGTGWNGRGKLKGK